MEVATIRVRYEETDQMGMVYYGNYFVWFEVGRTELFRKFGFPYTVMEENGIYLPVAEAHCNYKKSAKYDDEVRIFTEIASLSPARMVFSYKVLNPEGQVMAYGGTTHAFVNEDGKPVNLKKRAPWLWEKMQQVADIDGSEEV